MPKWKNGIPIHVRRQHSIHKLKNEPFQRFELDLAKMYKSCMEKMEHKNINKNRMVLRFS